MKKFGLGILIAVTVLVLSGIAVATPNQAAGEIDKTVFIHYPQGNVPYWSPTKAPALTDQDTTYKYTGIHWANPSVQYAVNPSNAPASAGVAIAASFQSWQDAPGEIIFTRLSDTILHGSLLLRDGSNVISWENISAQYPNAIAVTVVWYYRSSKAIVEVDTIMNSGPGFDWSVNVCSDPKCDIPANVSSYDVQNIMTHEAGHWLMLLDLYQWRTQKLTMYGYGIISELQKRTLGLGDELGIDRIY